MFIWTDAPKKKRGKDAQPKQSKRRKVQIEADFSDDDVSQPCIIILSINQYTDKYDYAYS